MTRPILKQEDRKNIFVGFMMTQSQKELLRQAAAKARLDMASFVRTEILKIIEEDVS